jgi:hypothetical protein
MRDAVSQASTSPGTVQRAPYEQRSPTSSHEHGQESGKGRRPERSNAIGKAKQPKDGASVSGVSVTLHMIAQPGCQQALSIVQCWPPIERYASVLRVLSLCRTALLTRTPSTPGLMDRHAGVRDSNTRQARCQVLTTKRPPSSVPDTFWAARVGKRCLQSALVAAR